MKEFIEVYLEFLIRLRTGDPLGTLSIRCVETKGAISVCRESVRFFGSCVALAAQALVAFLAAAVFFSIVIFIVTLASLWQKLGLDSPDEGIALRL